MRSLERNKIPFVYAHSLGNEEVLDENGNRTGSRRPVWGERKAAKANISPDRGAVAVEAFGAFADYDRVICYTPSDGIDLRELDAVWIDASTEEKHDYIVRRVARSINGVLAAVQRVVVS